VDASNYNVCHAWYGSGYPEETRQILKFREVPKMHRRTAFLILLLLLLSFTGIAFASLEGTWSDEFTSYSELYTTGALSYDYWLLTVTNDQENASVDVNIGDGYLTITHSKTGDITGYADTVTVDRLLNITSTEAIITVKWMQTNKEVSTYIKWLHGNSTVNDVIFDLQVWGGAFKVGYRNSTYNMVTTTGTPISENTWYITTITWQKIPNIFNVTLKYENGTEIATYTIDDAYHDLSEVYKVQIYTYVSSGQENHYGKFYIDYIKHSATYYEYENIIAAFLPVIMTFAMLSCSLALLKRYMK